MQNFTKFLTGMFFVIFISCAFAQTNKDAAQNDMEFMANLKRLSNCDPAHSNNCSLQVNSSIALLMYIQKCNLLNGLKIYYYPESDVKITAVNDSATFCSVTIENYKRPVQPFVKVCQLTQGEVQHMISPEVNVLLQQYEKTHRDIESPVIEAAFEPISKCVKGNPVFPKVPPPPVTS